MAQIPVIGFVGGIGAGKSTVAKAVCQQISAEVIDGDRIGHQVLEFSHVETQLKAQFGESIFADDNTVDRSRLGALVFGTDEDSKTRLKQLTEIMYPEIGRVIQQKIKEYRSESRVKLILLDAAVLFEAGWDQYCDQIAFVEVPDEIRKQRVIQNRHWTAEQWEQRELNQMALDQKRSRCSLVIPYSETAESMALWLVNAIQDRN